MSKHSAVPEAQGLFNPDNDKDSCGVGFVAGGQGHGQEQAALRQLPPPPPPVPAPFLLPFSTLCCLSCLPLPASCFPPAELSKEPNRQTVVEALEMLRRMTHRGACGCETNTGACADSLPACLPAVALLLCSRPACRPACFWGAFGAADGAVHCRTGWLFAGHTRHLNTLPAPCSPALPPWLLPPCLPGRRRRGHPCGHAPPLPQPGGAGGVRV